MTWNPPKPPFAQFKKEVFTRAAAVTDFIYQIGEYPQLRNESYEVPIDTITSVEFQGKITYLKNSLLKYRELTGYGRGIAAVQVGIPERFAVIYTVEKLLVIINPKITKKSEQLFLYPEMCMSANPIIAPVIRPAWVELDYYDELGNLQRWNTKADTVTGQIMNRVFQHEIDHLEGIINIDLVKSEKLILESDPNFYHTVVFKEVSR